MIITRSKTTSSSIFHSIPYSGRLSTILRYLSQSPSPPPSPPPSPHPSPTSPSPKRKTFESILSHKGIMFERLIQYDISNRLNIPIISVSRYITPLSIDIAIRCMKVGQPVIFNVPLIDEDGNKGIADMLIRSDYIQSVFPNYNNNHHGSCCFSPDWFYLVVEIKYTTLSLDHQSHIIDNSLQMQNAKAQCYIYSHLLGSLQGYTPSVSFVVGRLNSFSKEYYNHIGVVHLSDVEFVSVEEAVRWRRNRKHINEKQFNVWYVSKKYEDTLLAKGIQSIYDKRFNTRNMQMHGGKRAYTIDQILHTQRGDQNVVIPDYAVLPAYQPNEMFVDFEEIPGVLIDDLSDIKCIRDNFLFMIGVGYIDQNRDWNYTRFVANEMTPKEEERICFEFIKFIENTPCIYHWYDAEPQMWNRVLKKYPSLYSLKKRWNDLYILFSETPITIKGCTNFKLKNVAKTMYQHGCIPSTWDSETQDGLQCATDAYLYYTNQQEVDMDDIIRYNELDCKVMHEILVYLRKHHQ